MLESNMAITDNLVKNSLLSHIAEAAKAKSIRINGNSGVKCRPTRRKPPDIPTRYTEAAAKTAVSQKIHVL
jgi:hypothetical protein